MILTHFIDTQRGVDGWTVECDCGWSRIGFQEEWEAEEAGWYHVDFPEGE